jgi:phospholipase/carboxylesterase
MRTFDVAGLTVRLTGGSDREGGGDGPLVVLLHGFGAPGDDLVSLAQAIDAPPGTRWAFPAAPIDLSEATSSRWAFGGPAGSRAWWNIDWTARQIASERGTLADLARQTPAGIDEARSRLAGVLDELERDLRPSKVVLGGFSQGAMLACDLCLRTERSLAGIALLSGSIVSSETWAELAPRRRGLPVFQSHGVSDPVLPVEFARRLRDLLSASGAEVTWVEFRGGHGIADEVVQGLGSFLRRVLG